MIHQPRCMLVTGGAGFIGSNFVHYMLKTDPDVRIVNLDALTYAGSLENLRNLPDEARHTFVHGDICERVLVDRLLREFEIDTIVHFAAESHVDNSIAGPEVFVRTNVLGTFTLLEAARHYWLSDSVLSPPSSFSSSFRFHHISTDEVYGTLGPDDAAFTEASPYAPSSPYAASKAAADHLVRAFGRTYGLPVTISNSSNNYGPGQHEEKFIPTVIRACLMQENIPIYGDGSNIRDWLHVTDHCVAIDAVVRRGRTGEAYNIGAGEERSNLEVARLICRLMDELRPLDNQSPVTSYESLITFVQDRPGHDWRYALNTDKVAEELGWRPAIALEAGLRETLRWYIDNEPA